MSKKYANIDDELAAAKQLVNETVTRARLGDRLDIESLNQRFGGSPIVLLSAALLAAVDEPQPKVDNDTHPRVRDFRRATSFLAGWATSDDEMYAPPVEEAENDGRLHHLLAAVAEHAVLGLGLRHDPAQLAELRRSIAIWTNEEQEN